MESRQFVCLVFLAVWSSSRGQGVGCRHGQWQCDDGQCVPHAWRCDGEGDCLDGSDEMDCTAAPGSPRCPPGQFPCLDSGGCIDASARCDGRRQCPSGSDEENCTSSDGCLDSDWTCLNRLCIPKGLRCDGQDDCLDNSDEQGCGPCGEEGVRCPDGTCLPAKHRCDGTFQCSDGSDEPVTCGRICSVGNGGCSHVCVDEPWGALCACPPGYKLSNNGAACKDVDECSLPFAPCAHYCSNTVGSYRCRCRGGFTLSGDTACLATANATKLLTVQKSSLGLLNVKTQQFESVQNLGSDPVALTYNVPRGLFYWADEQGKIFQTDGRSRRLIFSGEPGIKGLACDWLNGHLFWTNQKTQSIYMGASDGSGYTTLLSKNISPSELLLLPVESLMFWVDAGPGDRVTLEKSWMDGTDRRTLVVLTAQSAHSLTVDVAARRLYWISDFKKSIETVKVDGSGRYSFLGIFSRRPASVLAVFESAFYWVDEKGLWQTPQNQVTQRNFIWKAVLTMLTVYHQLQQPQDSSACAKAPCELCQLTKGNAVGFTCACPNTKVLLPDGTCGYPMFVYATISTVNLLEFKGGDPTNTLLFTTKDSIVSFDMDWYKGWLYWANQTGHIQRTSLTQVKTEDVPMQLPVCKIKVDQRTSRLYWVSCDQSSVGVTTPDHSNPKQLYRTSREIRDLYVDWLRGGLLWLEEDRIFCMSLFGGEAKELLRLADGVKGSIALDLRGNSLLWNADKGGLTAMSLLHQQHHPVGRNLSGSVIAAFEPFLVTLSDDIITLWDRRGGTPLQHLAVGSNVLDAMAALKAVKAVPTVPICRKPSVLCKPTSVCLTQDQLCNGKMDCPDGTDESLCVAVCPSKDHFKCKDGRSCISGNLVCDGRAHCFDGSDEIGCPTMETVVAAVRPDTLQCSRSMRPCRDGTECVLYSHECDGEVDCKDGSDEEDCEQSLSPAALGSNRLPLQAPPNLTSPPPTQPACISPSVLCPSNPDLCISPYHLCDGYRDCPDGFDEKNCVNLCPFRTDFRCKDRRSCVSKALVCDGRSHCHDGSDESNCPTFSPPTTRPDTPVCRRGTKPCKDGSECVWLTHVCDGEMDCKDESDEDGCPDICKQGEFQCSHGRKCIPQALVCDGTAQCQDRSDEQGCWESSRSCEFRCADGKRCIPKKFLCDGERDCLDGTDELDCGKFSAMPSKLSGLVTATPTYPPAVSPTSACTPPSVLCPGSSLCIPQRHLCDGRRDCPDGFDEQDCIARCENPGDFLCSDRRRCILRSEVCDGRSHCPDGSDERQCQVERPLTPISRRPPVQCRTGFKPCRDGLECVMYSHVCDGESDCKDGSDEEDCATRCTEAEFQCSHGRRCIPREQVCDGRNDCQDQSDERNCEKIEGCHRRCDNNSRCVPESFLCDSERDCADGSDELNCGLVTCASHQYRCDSGQCVTEALRCDGYADCSDHSDETGCAKPPHCPAQLRCPHSHECLQREWLCDGEDDCKDGFDEKNCETAPANCREHQWQCGESSQCIPLTWMCDGRKDCLNGVDEDKCSQRRCAAHLYQCGSGECMDTSLVCNGVTNCVDGSDEGAGCSNRNCSTSPSTRCDHHCVSTPNGPRCYCAAGFELQSGSILCVDTDECNPVPHAMCKHTCLNTRGSYVCHCHPGFFLEPDNKSCKTKDEPLLLASVQSELLLLGVHSGTLSILSSANRPVFSLDYDWAQQRVYWLSADYQSIRWANMKNPHNKGTLVKGLKSDFIAVDWVGRNLYWVNGLVGQILAVPLSNSTVRSQDYTVVLDGLEQPSSLVLLPHRGLMLWSEIGSTPQIERAGMDGSGRKVVVSHGLSWPVSLTFDLLDNRVYWTDEKLRCIGSASLDGGNVMILQLAETPSPFSVAVFNDRVFWSDTKRRTIRSADKNTGKDQRVLLKRPGQPFGLKVMHALSQPATSSPCDQQHCSHFCFLALRGKSADLAAVCRCPTGLTLSKDARTCSLPVESAFLMLLFPTTAVQIYLQSMRREGIGLKKMPTNVPFVLPGLKDASSQDLSMKGRFMYVADAGQRSVQVLKVDNLRSRQGLTPAGQILKLKEDFVTALALDWVTSNMYWSSELQADLHVTSPQGQTAWLLQGAMKGTTSIAVHPPTGRLCYTSLIAVGAKAQPQVNCAYMDGRNKVVLWRKSSVPLALVFDKQGTVVYWADAGDGVVNAIRVDGSGYKQYKLGPGLLSSFTFSENLLFWTTVDKDVTRLWFSDGLQPNQVWFETKMNIVELRAYSEDTQSGTNGCSNNNGGCSHLCLANPEGRTCRCGRGFRSVNVTSCLRLHPCPDGKEPCLDGNGCVGRSKLCDGQPDCRDQSDEAECSDALDAETNWSLSDSNFKFDHTPESPSSHINKDKDSVALVSKDSAPCDPQRCSGHGTCVAEDKGFKCHCISGYTGEFCQDGETSQSYTGAIVAIFFVVALVVSGIFAARSGRLRAWPLIRRRSMDTETLMANMGLPNDQIGQDSEEQDSPVDVKNPPLPLRTLKPKKLLQRPQIDLSLS